MLETQLGRVQRQPSDFAVVLDLRLSKGATVLDVATDRVPQFSQMDTDLVGATGFQAALHFAVRPNFSQRLEILYARVLR